MALNNTTKQAIKAKLRLGSTPQEVSEQFSVNIQTVYAINKLVGQEIEDENLQELHELPQEVIAHVIDEAKSLSPAGSHALVEAMDVVADGSEGLKKLSMAFQATMTNVLSRFDEALKDKELGLKDIKLVSDTVANAYEKVFSSGTSIHIGDNNTSNQQLTMFKNKSGV